MSKSRGVKAQPEAVSEMIGRSSNNLIFGNIFPVRPTVDLSRSDYVFWAKVRRGKAEGYRLGALFAPAIGQIMTSWVLGGGFDIRAGEDEYTNMALKDFIDDNLEYFHDCAYDGYTLGDGALAVNPDGTITAISPDQLTIETNRFDWRRVDAYTITSLIDQPINFVRDIMRPDFNQRITAGQGMVTIHDRYTIDERAVSIQDGSTKLPVQTFPNLIGRLPIVHFAQSRETNEVTGHPIYEHLLYLFARYDNAINKALDAVEVMGNPFLAIEGLKNPRQAKEDNATSTETVMEADGTTRSESYIDINNVDIWWLGEGANMKFVAPGSFTQDTGRMLELLFYLMLQSCLIPEHVWGGAIASSNASVDAQLPSFVRAVEGWRLKSRRWLLETCEVWRAWMALSDPRINTNEKLTIEFPEVAPEDAKILIEKMALARKEMAVDRKLLVRKLDITDDPEQAVADADTESEEARQRFETEQEAAINRMADNEQAPGENPQVVPAESNGRPVAVPA